MNFTITFTGEKLKNMSGHTDVVTSIFWELTCYDTVDGNDYEAKTKGEIVLVPDDDTEFDSSFIEFANISNKQETYMDWFNTLVGQYNFDNIKDVLHKQLIKRKEREVTKQMLEAAPVELVTID